jgi:uncharacterized protein YbaR (Trm112 family)
MLERADEVVRCTIGGPVTCACGKRLVDRLEEDVIVVDEVPRLFRRATDHLVCVDCKRSYPIKDVRERSRRFAAVTALFCMN